MMAEKCIKADEIIPMLKSLSDDTTCPIHIAAELDQIVEGIPVVDAVEVVYAEWVLRQSNGYAVCNNCCRGDYVDPLATHCRYCGALMKQ
jgi:hypothetical protein